MTDDSFNNRDKEPIGNRQSAIGNDSQSAIGNVFNRQSENGNSLDLLRRFVRSRSVPMERCDMCSIGLSADHPHLVEPATRRLICSCQACAILFSGTAGTKYRRVPREVRYVPGFQMTPAQWEGLLIPINMAFFFHSSVAERVIVLYPSPAGATESLLDFESWQEIVKCNPVLEQMEPDTEALLVNRVRGASDYFIVPIDECYRLVGLIRTKWKGLSGGAEVWEVINGFFADLKERSTRVREAAHA